MLAPQLLSELANVIMLNVISAVTAFNQMVTESYLYLLLWEQEPPRLLSSKTETLNIDEKGIRSTLSSEQAYLAPKANAVAYSTISNPLHQFQFPVGLHREIWATDFPKDTTGSQRQIATGSTRTINEVQHNAIGNHAKSIK